MILLQILIEQKKLYSLQEFENNLETLIFQAKKYNPKNITFIGLTNVDEKLACPLPQSTENVIKMKELKNGGSGRKKLL